MTMASGILRVTRIKRLSVLILIGVIPLMLFCVGCGGLTTKADAIELQVMPAAISADGSGTPNAIVVMAYLYQLVQPQPVEAAGTLEMLLFDGNLSGQALESAKPLQTWRFGRADLVRFRTRGLPGWGYGMQLVWTQRPSSNMVTVQARYVQGDGKTLRSAPVTISVEQK